MHIKQLFALLIILASSLNLRAQTIDYQPKDSLAVVQLLRSAQQKGLSAKDDMGQRVIHFARQLMGKPYVAKTLEGNTNEHLVVNLRQLDCTTFVETVLALARTNREGKTSFADYCKQLRLLRYKEGKVDYVHRLHYFVYWMLANEQAGHVRRIETPTPPFSQTLNTEVNFMTTHPTLYPMLNGNADRMAAIARMEEAVSACHQRYIPKTEVTNSPKMREIIHDGDILAIITNKKGLDTSHVGLALWQKDGLHLVHASTTHHRVVIDPSTLRNYLMRHASQTGIMVARPL